MENIMTYHHFIDILYVDAAGEIDLNHKSIKTKILTGNTLIKGIP